MSHCSIKTTVLVLIPFLCPQTLKKNNKAEPYNSKGHKEQLNVEQELAKPSLYASGKSEKYEDHGRT